MINYIVGDITEATEDIIAHGVNCKGAFGSGVAGSIRKKWPRVYASYMEKHLLYGWQLGEVQFCFADYALRGPIVANMASQKDFGYDGKLYADYNAIKMCFTSLLWYVNNKGLSVAMPKVACGLAGADWNKVSSILQNIIKEKSYKNLDIKVYSL